MDDRYLDAEHLAERCTITLAAPEETISVRVLEDARDGRFFALLFWGSVLFAVGDGAAWYDAVEDALQQAHALRGVGGWMAGRTPRPAPEPAVEPVEG